MLAGRNVYHVLGRARCRQCQRENATVQQARQRAEGTQLTATQRRLMGEARRRALSDADAVA